MRNQFENYARNLNRIHLHMFIDHHDRQVRIARARASLVVNPLANTALPAPAPTGAGLSKLG